MGSEPPLSLHVALRLHRPLHEWPCCLRARPAGGHVPRAMCSLFSPRRAAGTEESRSHAVWSPPPLGGSPRLPPVPHHHLGSRTGTRRPFPALPSRARTPPAMQPPRRAGTKPATSSAGETESIFPQARSEPSPKEEHVPPLVARAPLPSPAVLLPDLDGAGEGPGARLPLPHRRQLPLRADVGPGTEKERCAGVCGGGRAPVTGRGGLKRYHVFASLFHYTGAGKRNPPQAVVKRSPPTSPQNLPRLMLL